MAKLLADRARHTQQTLGVGIPESVTAFPGYEDPSLLSEDEFDFEDFSRKVRRVPELAEAIDRMWPRLSPHELLHDLFGARPLINAAGRGVLAPEELDLLYRPRSASFEEVRWTSADAALVDEARHLLGPRSGSSDDATRQYGHIVIDEVQDLSPMQLRMLTRRSLSGSMTVVGDIAQATAPWAPRSWTEIIDHLPRRRPARTVELTVSYRTPAEVLAVASQVLAVAAPELTPPRPVRRTGVEPRMIAVRDPSGSRQGATQADLFRFVAQVAGEEVAAVAPGRVAILAPEPILDSLAEALGADGRTVVDARDMGKGGLLEPLVLLAADAANGLEFDSVVVVEPGVIAGETARGLRTLYVALTRPTQRLSVVHLAPAPAPWTPATEAGRREPAPEARHPEPALRPDGLSAQGRGPGGPGYPGPEGGPGGLWALSRAQEGPAAAGMSAARGPCRTRSDEAVTSGVCPAGPNRRRRVFVPRSRALRRVVLGYSALGPPGLSPGRGWASRNRPEGGLRMSWPLAHPMD